jgi:hypothetical protein
MATFDQFSMTQDEAIPELNAIGTTISSRAPDKTATHIRSNNRIL